MLRIKTMGACRNCQGRITVEMTSCYVIRCVLVCVRVGECMALCVFVNVYVCVYLCVWVCMSGSGVGLNTGGIGANAVWWRVQYCTVRQYHNTSIYRSTFRPPHQNFVRLRCNFLIRKWQLTTVLPSDLNSRYRESDNCLSSRLLPGTYAQNLVVVPQGW